MLRRLTAAALLATLTACVPAGEDGPGVDPNVGEDTGGSGGDDTGGAQDAGGEQDTGGGEVDAGGGAQDAGGGPVADVPTDGAAMFTWLQRGEYEAWPAESGVHASTGPHGQVRTFINPTLESSLQAESAEHPVGAASVKELYRDAEVFGWAVMVKTQAGTGGESWYWYEVFSTTDGSNPVADGNGVGLCAGCHSAGVDNVRTPFPLQ